MIPRDKGPYWPYDNKWEMFFYTRLRNPVAQGFQRMRPRTLVDVLKRRSHKMQHGYDYKDLWNLSTYHAQITADMLRDFRLASYSWPISIASREEWLNILIRMERGFRNWIHFHEWSDANTDYSREHFMERYNASFASLRESMNLMAQYYDHLWD